MLSGQFTTLSEGFELFADVLGLFKCCEVYLWHLSTSEKILNVLKLSRMFWGVLRRYEAFA